MYVCTMYVWKSITDQARLFRHSLLRIDKEAPFVCHLSAYRHTVDGCSRPMKIHYGYNNPAPHFFRCQEKTKKNNKNSRKNATFATNFN